MGEARFKDTVRIDINSPHELLSAYEKVVKEVNDQWNKKQHSGPEWVSDLQNYQILLLQVNYQEYRNQWGAVFAVEAE